MVKKLLLFLYILPALFLNSFSGYGQSCPDGTQNSSVSISTSKANICAGEEVSFTSTVNFEGTNPTFVWKVNGTVQTGVTGPTFTTSALTSATNKVVVEMTTSCEPPVTVTSNEITITANAVRTPTVAISVNKNTLCPAENITFTASNSYGGSNPQYQWFINSGTTAVKTGETATFTGSDFPSGENTVRVVMTSNFNCVTSTTAENTSAVFNVRADVPSSPGAITGSITGADNLCPATSLTYSIDPVDNAEEYIWTLPSGWTGSSSTNSISVTAGSTGGTISVSAKNSCGTSSTAATFDVSVKSGTPAVPGAITGNTAVCPGVTESYSISAVSGATAYIWTLPDGTTEQTTTSPSIDVTTNASGNSNISVKAFNDCGTSEARTLSVTVKPGIPEVPAAFSGTLEVCPGTSQSYSISPVTGAAEYIWTLPTGWEGTSTTTSITVTSGTVGGNITVAAKNDCGTGPVLSQEITMKDGIPAIAASISGATAVCPGTSETFSIDPIDGATSYVWTLPGGWAGTSTTTSIDATTGTSGGNITVKAVNDCGVGETKSLAVTVSNPAPVMTGVITGPESVCAGKAGTVYTIPAIENASSYIWNIPSDWTINGSSTSNSISVTPGPTNASISVIAKNDCGESLLSPELIVNSSTGVPPTPGDISTNLTTSAICPVVNNVQFSISPVTGATGYNWILPTGWEITAGANTEAIVVKISASQTYASPTQVKVEAVNICGKSSASTSQNIFLDNYIVTDIGSDLTVCKSPTFPLITLNGNISFGQAGFNPTLTTSGNGTFSGLGNNIKGSFTVKYQPTQDDYNLGQVTIKMTVPKPTTGNSSSCGTGEDEMILYFKPLPIATITTTSPICNGAKASLIFNGTPNSRITYKKDSGANRTVDIGPTGTATVETEALTANSSFSLVSAINLDTPACTATLTSATPAIVTVTPKPTITSFTYGGSPFCASTSSAQVASITGTNGYLNGTFSSTTGLDIDPASGEINPSTSTVGTYTVTYSTPEAGGCEPVIATTEITITPTPTASITYGTTPFCTSDATPHEVTQTGTNGFSGGTYSAPEGLNINPTTGAITANTSTPGEYTVTYSTPVAGGCSAVLVTTQVTITDLPTVTISYPEGSFCQADTTIKPVVREGSGNFEGGKYSAPTGLIIDEDTGGINPSTSTPGTYTVTYTAPASAGCGEVLATTEIKITETPSAVISYDGPFCTADGSLHAVTFSNTAGSYEGGTFHTNTGGLLGLNPNTGEINANTSTPGTYIVTYSIPAGEGCEATPITAEVKIIQQPQATITYTSPLCTSDTMDYEVAFTTEAGNYSGGIFSATPGLSIDADGTISPDTSTPGNHTITYTFPSVEGCGDSEIYAEIEILDKPLITSQPQNLGICSSNPASFEVFASGDNLSYQWFHKPIGGEFAPKSGATSSLLSFSNATSVDAGEYYVVVSGAASCETATSEIVTLNVDEEIIIIKPTEDQTFCDKEISEIIFEFIAHANNAPLTFTWIKDGADITPDGSKYLAVVSAPQGENGEYTGALTVKEIGLDDNGVYAVRIEGPDYFTCAEATSKTFTLNINPLPEAPSTTAIQYCKGDETSALTATGASGAVFRWYGSESGDDFISESAPIPNTDTPGTTSYWVAQITEACESPRTELVVTVKDKPAVPATAAEVHYCFGAETMALSATGADGSTINWYASEDSETPLGEAPTPGSGSVGSTTFWVSQSTPDACESDRTPVVVTIDPLPNPVITASETTICAGTTITLTASGGDSYSWTVDGAEVGTEASIPVTPTVTTIYSVKATNTSGCTNFSDITITVDEATVAGTIDGPDSVCESSANGILELTGNTGEITKWENKSASASEWTAFSDGDLSPIRSFSNLTETTTFKATVKNGVCGETTVEKTVIVDPVPQGGILAFAISDPDKDGRIFLTCENPGSDYAVDLNLTGKVGEIVGWKYRVSTSTGPWSTVMLNGEVFTGDFLSADQIEALNLASTVQTTVFAVEVKSGVCSPNVLSKAALLSVIPADIEPSPVKVDPAVICIGETISLSSESGYSAPGGEFEGGMFDDAGIKNKGWNFTNLEGGNNDFSSAADNGRPDHWLRTTPKDKFYTADINTHTVTPQIWDSKELPEGNDGFAIVTGDNGSLMETPVFSLDGLDEAVLTFDQAYNLTLGDSIWVELSINGGASYEIILFEMGGPRSSGNYSTFGDGTPETRPKNKMVFDLGAYMGYPNLRVRFNYQGNRDGAVWAVDNITVPDGPQNAQLIWYYDDPGTTATDLKQIGEINQEVVPFVPEYIGWNAFQVQTELILDSQGNTCHSLKNEKDVQVFVYDKYTIATEAVVGTCGTNTIELRAKITGLKSGDITNTAFPTADGYIGQWKVTNLEGIEVTAGFELVKLDPSSIHESAINDPNVRFAAENLDTYIFTYELVQDGSAVYPEDYFIDGLRGTPLANPGCPPLLDPVTIELVDCTTLDFDGVDDVVTIENNFSEMNSIEAWIRPEAGTGTIIAGPTFEITVPTGLTLNDRWYHIAVVFSGAEAGLYLDGIRITDAPAKFNSDGDRSSIGARWTSAESEPADYFSGWIEEVRIWNVALTQKQIRFMMNQRIKLTGVNPEDQIEGEIVPNLAGTGSYKAPDGHNLDKDGVPFYDLSWNNLLGYYRLISEFPDPDLELVSNEYKPVDGYTPDLSLNDFKGRLYNMTTHQQNTSPVPYISGTNGIWDDRNTWLRPSVWDFPNSTATGGSPIDWNIAEISHNITSNNRDIDLLGLISVTNTLDMQGTIPTPTGNELYVSHYLKLDGVIDLNGESQLVQPDGSLAIGGGWIERDQQGLASSYNYNYWSSPVAGAFGQTSYSVNDVMFDGTTNSSFTLTGSFQSIQFGNGPFYADTPKKNPIGISNYWIFAFTPEGSGVNANMYSEWKPITSAGTISIGEGYTMKGSWYTSVSTGETQNYTFKGFPNNGNINMKDIYIKQNYLIGNPYPSAISVEKFLADNENATNGAVYFWDHFGGQSHILKEYVGGYATRNNTAGTPAASVDFRIDNSGDRSGKTPGPFIPVGQGFYINSTLEGSSTPNKVVFNNTQREFATEADSGVSLFHSQEEKKEKKQVTNSQKKPLIRLNFNSPKGYWRQIAVGAIPETSSQVDYGYDAPMLDNNVEDMFWVINESKFVIQGVPDFSSTRVLPLGIKIAKEGKFSIEVAALENISEGTEIFIKDNLYGLYFNITEKEFSANLEPGEYKDRYEIVFEEPQLVDESEIILPGEFDIMYVNGTREITLRNPKLQNISKVFLNNILGQQVHVYHYIPEEHEVKLPVKQFSSGIYIVKAHVEEGIITKKIIIE